MNEPECECSEGEGCHATSPGKGYFCTRKPNHEPPHVACSNVDHHLAVWSEEER